MVKVIPRSNCKCLTFYQQAGGGPLTERLSSMQVKVCFGRYWGRISPANFTKTNLKNKEPILYVSEETSLST